MRDADTLREIAVEIERYNHMKSAKKLNEIADRIVALGHQNDELNLILGFAIGQMLNRGIIPDEPIVEYMRARGLLCR